MSPIGKTQPSAPKAPHINAGEKFITKESYLSYLSNLSYQVSNFKLRILWQTILPFLPMLPGVNFWRIFLCDRQSYLSYLSYLRYQVSTFEEILFVTNKLTFLTFLTYVARCQLLKIFFCDRQSYLSYLSYLRYQVSTFEGKN